MVKTSKEFVISSLNVMADENGLYGGRLERIREGLHKIPEDCAFFKSISKKLDSREDRASALAVIEIFHNLREFKC